MQPSDELKSLILLLYKKENDEGLFRFAQELYSKEDGVLVIGSEPGEGYAGYEGVLEFYRREGETHPEVEVKDIQAFTKNGFGWVVDRVSARLPGGMKVPVRHTYLFHQEGNTWKVIHAHISVGIPDKDLGTIFQKTTREPAEE